MNRISNHRFYKQRSMRRGSVYVAVLGTALVASTLALSALALQRIQNRQLTLAGDVRQAQLNAEAAIEVGLLAIRNDEDWRQTYGDVDGEWFTQNTENGSYRLEVHDPVDGELEGNEEDPVVLLGIGTSGHDEQGAEQRVELTVDPRQQPADVLYTVTDAGGILANQSASFDWETAIDTYQAAGTEINVNSLPSSTPNLGRNTGIENDETHWFGTKASVSSADIDRTNNYRRSGGYSLAVDDRANYYSGAMQSVDHLVEPGDRLEVEIWVYHRYRWLGVPIPVSFILTLYTKGLSDSGPVNSAGTSVSVPADTWTPVTATLEARNWNGALDYAFVKIAGIDNQLGNTADFWVDDLTIREATSGPTKFIYHRVLGPGVNPFGTSNANGIYWINCGGNKVVIERSRILGTLLLLNPGNGSQISNGPVHFAPAKLGYPSLVVDGDFSIRATNRALIEAENCASTYEGGTNYNPSDPTPFDSTPSSIPYEFNNALCSSTDTTANSIYPSEIHGLVAVSGNLTFANSPRIRGQVIAGGTITGTPTLEQRLDAVFNPPPEFTGTPNYERRPSSARKTVVPPAN